MVSLSCHIEYFIPHNKIECVCNFLNSSKFIFYMCCIAFYRAHIFCIANMGNSAIVYERKRVRINIFVRVEDRKSCSGAQREKCDCHTLILAVASSLDYGKMFIIFIFFILSKRFFSICIQTRLWQCVCVFAIIVELLFNAVYTFYLKCVFCISSVAIKATNRYTHTHINLPIQYPIYGSVRRGNFLCSFTNKAVVVAATSMLVHCPAAAPRHHHLKQTTRRAR